MKFEGTSLAMPVPPSKKRLIQIDHSLVDGGELKGVPCVAVKVVWYQNGAQAVIEAQGRKISLAEIRLSLLTERLSVIAYAWCTCMHTWYSVAFWGAKGAPILFSEIGFYVASCSYIYMYIVY